MSRWRSITPMLLSLVVLLTMGHATTIGQAQSAATVTPTPPANQQPDRCEPNEERDRACSLEIDQVNGPFTFLPAGDQDFYRLVLEPTGLQTEISVRATPGLDLLTSISRDDGSALARFASPTISTTLAPDISGGVIIRVENRAPAVAGGESYGIEVRQSLPPVPTALPAGNVETHQPDILEDNWNIASAAPIGVGVIYELNFVCPVVWGCAGGDHDYLRLPVKAGTPYLIATFDLGPGVDTVLDLFWQDMNRPVVSSDDARPGSSFLSVLHWVAPADGEAILRVGPRTGGLQPQVDDEDAGHYRLAVALAGSDLAAQLEDRIRTQTNAPSPTTLPSPPPRAAAPPASAPSAPGVAPTALPVSTDAPTGTAIVRVDSSVLREAPDRAAPAIQTLPRGAEVTLLGQASGGWVRVQPLDGVVPGWLRGTDLARAAPASPTPAGTPTRDTFTPTPIPTTSNDARSLVVDELDPLPPPALPMPEQQVAVTLEVQVVMTSVPLHARDNLPVATPLPATLEPLANLRVQLVNAFGDVLAEALTDTAGQVTLSAEVAPGTALLLQLPAIGVQATVEPEQSVVQVVLTAQEERP